MEFGSPDSIKVSETVSNPSSLSKPTSEVVEFSKPGLELDCFPWKRNFGSHCSKQFSNGDVPHYCCWSITDLPPTLISEILNFLEPKELGVVSCVSTVLNRLASENHVWKQAYCERWGLPVVPAVPSAEISSEKSWKELFVEKEFRCNTFLGQYRVDALYGHREAVRTVFLLASAKLIFTSGYDSVVWMWNMEGGYSVASSHPLGCTIRAIAADTKLLVAGGTDGFIQGWRAINGQPHLFDLRGSDEPSLVFRLWEHEGPVTSLNMDASKIYSGSWDMTVRIWDRASLKCLEVLRHSDWVWALAPHGSTVASASGADVYLWNVTSGTLLTVICRAHAGNTYALARSHTGNFLFTGGEDGVIQMFEIVNHGPRSICLKVATWIPHSGPVYSLAFEFPWLVSASSDGKLSLIDVRKLLRKCGHCLRKGISRVNDVPDRGIEPPQRMLHGFGANLFSVDIGADRIICGGEEGIVRIWDFSEAIEIERRVLALRRIRLENRMQRRRLQLEIGSSKGSRGDQCSLAAKLNPMHTETNGVCQSKRGMSGKLRA